MTPTHLKVHLGSVSTGYIEVGFLRGIVGTTVFFGFGGNTERQDLTFDKITFYVQYKKGDMSYIQYRQL
jgi:hypothetical protein